MATLLRCCCTRVAPAASGWVEGVGSGKWCCNNGTEYVVLNIFAKIGRFSSAPASTSSIFIQYISNKLYRFVDLERMLNVLFYLVYSNTVLLGTAARI